MRKYMTRPWLSTIEEVAIEKETETFVWVGNRRTKKVSRHSVYHDTFDAAKTHLVNMSSDKIRSLEKQLSDENILLENRIGILN